MLNRKSVKAVPKVIFVNNHINVLVPQVTNSVRA